MVLSSTMSLVKVWTEIDETTGKCASLPAKIISKKGNVYKISYLSVSEERDAKNRRVYKYEDEIYEVSDDSITEYLDSDTELDFGFEEIEDGKFVKCDLLMCENSDGDDDEDYTPSSEDESETASDENSDDDDEEDFDDDGGNFSD